MRLRLFYRSNSEWARRSCPWERQTWWLSKWEKITNSSYETTTRVSRDIQQLFDSLNIEQARIDPITLKWSKYREIKSVYDEYSDTRSEKEVNSLGYDILSEEMSSEIKVNKLFSIEYRDTAWYLAEHYTKDVINMYNSLWKDFDLRTMQLIEWKGYTYEHDYLWTIDVNIGRLKINWKDLDFSFAKVKNDPQNRVRIEEVNYADAKVSSFWIYDKQVNAAPLTWKPIDYTRQVPRDRYGSTYWKYMDIRDLYQGNPIIKRFKELSQIDNTYTRAA